MKRTGRAFLLATVLAVGSVMLPPPRGGAAEATYEVEAIRDIEYRPLCVGEDPDKGKNRLDLYLPRGRKDFPVLFFVHGGAWRHGDKSSYLGFYSTLGRFWARQGIGTVVTNYRLSPAVRHPEHIKDVVRAFAWTYQNIAGHGGRPDQIFACGHSAGGHLVSLLATDESYLKAEGLTRAAVRGVIPISGVYDVVTLNARFLASVFGTDPEARKRASPLCQVGSAEPPFLILYADQDFPTCDAMSEKFCRALKDAQCQARTIEVKAANHVTILLRASTADDAVMQAIREFIVGHAAPAAGEKTGGGGQ